MSGRGASGARGAHPRERVLRSPSTSASSTTPPPRRTAASDLAALRRSTGARLASVRERATGRGDRGSAAAEQGGAPRGGGRWRRWRRRLRVAGGVARTPVAASASLLRRSLQVRVVVTTVALGLVTVTGVGLVLGEEISQRLLDGRRDQATEQAARGTITAQQEFSNADIESATDVRSIAVNLVDTLEKSGPEGDVTVLLLRPPGKSSFDDLTGGNDVTPAQIPADLREAVRSSPDQRSRSLGLPRDGADAPALAVGQVVEVPIVGTYELYFVFDLAPEQATLDAVQRVLLLGAGFLVLLVALVAALVARQVVRPVRAAAAVAQRLAAGDLEQRMDVRGRDDLARLAGSFNAMAASIRGQITRLETLGALQQHFVSDVSHELRTPLTTIRMAGELLYESRSDFPPALARSAELLYSQVDHFENLLADLLEISRYDAGAAVLDVEALDLRAVVTTVVEQARPVAGARSTPLSLEVPDEPCVAEVDRRRVERVVRNLVGNALAHGRERAVTVTVAADDGAVAVRVRDHGVGLTPAQCRRVFDRFWRAEPSRGRVGGPGGGSGGTGLGLAIAREDALLHAGRLDVWGRLGQGASFVLTLPRGAGGPLTSAPLAADPDPVAVLLRSSPDDPPFPPVVGSLPAGGLP